MATRVLLVDDQQLMREVLGRLLSYEADLDLVGVAGSAQEAVDVARCTRPEVVVMDVDLGETDGVLATRELLELDPTVRVVMLSAWCSRSLVLEAAGAGAQGYLLKGDPADELLAGIRAAARGGNPVSAQVLAHWPSWGAVLNDRAPTTLPPQASGAT